MRLFVGIPLETAVIGELRAVVTRLRRRDDGLRWAAPETWHVTLEFLGDAGPEQLQCMAARLGEVRSPPVRVTLGTLDFFDRTGIFFAGVEVSPQLTVLQQSVAAATGRCGFTPETRPYHPHITLARAKGGKRGQGSGVRGQGTAAREPSGLSGLKARVQHQPTFTRFVAQEFLLYESFLGPGGSRYEVRGRFPLH